ncbi:MAG: Nif3-like dinuclear metal center hexameric protein [Spirochaetota bacterium]
MLLRDIDIYLRNLLAIDPLEGTDSSVNGIQVSRNNKEISRVAFSVDACLEVFTRASVWGAELLFVHHGLLWGKAIPITGIHYQRLKFLLDHDLALYAVHLPLDMHASFGNNAGIVKLLGLQAVEPFGLYKGYKIGYKGVFPEDKTLTEIIQLMGMQDQARTTVLPFGPEKIRTAGVISGGAPREVEQAIMENLDLFVTGDASHEIYHQCQEARINVIFGGHYNTEVWGVRQLSEKIKADTGLTTTFINVPTGL